ncbi:MAG: M56 family metallopeptidase [Acidobacteriia bacterium]|nr:M56 family metallopeptidase [Terriglobia bacterium]
MTASLFLDNLLAWSAQVAILAAVAAAAAVALQHPRARLLFWQAILATILLLPAVEPWAPAIVVSNNGVSISMQSAAIAPNGGENGFVWQREYLLLLIAAGAALRLLWIAAGFLRLRAHRLAASTLADPPVPFERPHVRWYLSDTVSGPVTFGWLRPSILLPARVNRLPEDLREAIACHELVHVERADWLFVLAEEMIRAVLWFHPAVWLVLSRIQLSREQTVDREVIGLTQNRDRYLDALVAVAQHKLQPDVAPAPLFLKKRQLAVRVADVLKETRMSKPRIAVSFATVLSAALVAARVAVWFFPLQAPAQSIADGSLTAPDAPGVTVDAGAPLMHRAPVARGSSTASGIVLIDASVNAKGEVTDARVVSGPEELRKPALESVLQWHYSTIASLPPTIQVSIRFDPVSFGQPGAVRIASTPATPPSPSVIKQIQFAGATAEVERQVRQRLTVHEGDALVADSLQKIVSAAREVDEHFTASVFTRSSPGGPRETTVRLVLGAPAAPPMPAGIRADATQTAPGKIRVGGNAQQANLIVKVTPSYPADAKQARIQGVVKLTATINRDGTVQSLDLISGEPVLANAAIDAVKQWVYKPTLLNGNPVEVVTQIDVNFTLAP